MFSNFLKLVFPKTLQIAPKIICLLLKGDKVDSNRKLLSSDRDQTSIQIKDNSQPGSAVTISISPTDLSIGDADKPLIHQLVPEWVPGLTLHDVALSCFVSQRDSWHLRDEEEM